MTTTRCLVVVAVILALGTPAEAQRVDSRETHYRILAVDRVVTFLAVLEMARLRWIEIEQEEHLGPVWLTSQMPATTDVGAVVGRITAVGA